MSLEHYVELQLGNGLECLTATRNTRVQRAEKQLHLCPRGQRELAPGSQTSIWRNDCEHRDHSCIPYKIAGCSPIPVLQ